MTMAAALIAAVAQIHLKCLKLSTVECRERLRPSLGILLSEGGDGCQGEGMRGPSVGCGEGCSAADELFSISA